MMTHFYWIIIIIIIIIIIEIRPFPDIVFLVERVIKQ